MKYRWDKKYLYWGITAFIVVACCIAFYQSLNNWSEVKAFFGLILNALSPVIFGFIIAYLLNKVLTFFENALFLKLGARMFPKKPKKAKRSARMMSIILTMLLAIVIVGGLLALVLPQIYNSIVKLVDQMPGYVSVAKGWLERFLNDNPELESTITDMVGNISDYFTNWIKTSVLPRADELITNITGGVISVVRGVVSLLIGIILSIYIMYYKETFGAQIKKLLYSVLKPKRANGLLEKISFLDKTFGGFITGKLIDSLIIGLLCYIVLSIINMPYATLISVIICVTNIIPFFGPFIGSIPSALLILLESPVKCLVFIIFILILQQFDSNILEPKILGNKTGLSGFWIMFSILLFGSLFGFWGLIFGVPVFAVIYAGLRNFSNNRLSHKNLPIGTTEFENIAFIDYNTNTPVYKTNKVESEAVNSDSDDKKKPRKKKDHEKDL